MISVVLGTRPEIIKMSSIIRELQERGEEYEVIHTGQHYDPNLSEVFFDELDLPRPDHFLEVGSGSQGEQTAKALMKIEKKLMESDPDVVLVQGDTNTVLAGALAGVKMGIEVGHVEAGLRSYDYRMPEEHNRRATDHLSSLLFAPTKQSEEILKGEKVWGKIFVTGNTVIDACNIYSGPEYEKKELLAELPENFILATAHRAENVDDSVVLKGFLRVFNNAPFPVVYPMHPRTRNMMDKLGLWDSVSNNLKIIEPLGYLEFLTLLKNCRFVMTDSGGIQEEATAPNIRKKVFVLRKSTERPEAVEAGFAEVVGTDAGEILQIINGYDLGTVEGASPYGDGKTGKKIVGICLGGKKCQKK